MRIFYLFYENKKVEISPRRNYRLGRSKDNDIVLQDARVSRFHATLQGQGDHFILHDENSTNGSWFEGRQIDHHPLLIGDSFRLGNCNLEIQQKESDMENLTPPPSDTMMFESKVSEILEEVKDPQLADRISELKNFYNRKKESLALMAFRDKLTNLYNRGYFDRKLEQEFERAQRYKRPLSLIMVDIDHFKSFNDNYGHQKGDEVLAGVAAILKETSRTMDFCCRYGGEEMAIILPETHGNQAFRMAELCCLRVEENSRDLAETTVTISLGISQMNLSDNKAEALIKRADQSLYQAKDKGRNQAQWIK